MKITDKLIADVKKSQTTVDATDEKILEFPSDDLYYRAFAAPTPDTLLRLKIHTKRIRLMPRYDLLYDVAYTTIGDFVGLIYPHMRVKMFGRNLKSLVDGLSTNSVEWVREYNPPIWQFEKDVDPMMQACIDEIIIESVPLDPHAEIKAREDSQVSEGQVS